MREIPETDGEMQRLIEAALEHLSNAWGGMVRIGMASGPNRWPPRGQQEDMIAESLANGINYVWRVFQGMQRQWGTTDGQLCPWDDCAHDLAIPEEGWYLCGHCNRLLYARVCDSDYEDYHTSLPSEMGRWRIERPIKTARDLGPSWATPKEDNDGQISQT